MYIRSSHRARERADVLKVMKEEMFATLITCGADGLIASHLPFVFDETIGEHGTLFAHMARANPHSAVLVNSGESLVTFLGPHAYISPSWYEDRAAAPTWDYVAVHCYGAVVLHTVDAAETNLQRLINVVEANRDNPWSVKELPRSEVQAMIKNIVSFEISLSRIEAKFKLNQGEKAERTRTAIKKLDSSGNTEIAAYIREYNDLS